MSSFARYLIRFDDVTPTSRWDNWRRIQAICDNYRVKPLIAVVPDNQDGRLMAGPPRGDFWSWVRERQACGWGIAMHGLTHVYETKRSGIAGINRRSEWAGVARGVQESRLDRGLAIFRDQGVRVDGWVAPGHSMDSTTAGLLVSRGIKLVSDGLFPFPARDRQGLLWIPQQLWRFRPMPFGIWTVCYHSDRWGEMDFMELERELTKYRKNILDWSTAAGFKPRMPWGMAHHLCAPMARVLLRWKVRHE